MRRLACACAATAALGCFGPEHLEPAEGGRDFTLQGEYTSVGWGAQVIARGGGNFLAVLRRGGLPGAGWDGSEPDTASGRDDGAAVELRGEFDATLQGGTLRVRTAEGQSFVLRQVLRESPTAQAKPPPGAVTLFDGSGIDAFAEAKLDPRGFLAAGATTREPFGDFTLHLEFRTPFMPDARGQFRGNSGVYLQNRYEIQVLDSFGLPAATNECGAVYEQRAPDVPMSFPPLSWQTYDVEFQAARFDASGRKTAPAVLSVRHNGVPIHEKVTLDGATGRGDPESAAPGPLLFQDHWNAVVYRNIWLVPSEGGRSSSVGSRGGS
jgi:hypothetical protein